MTGDESWQDGRPSGATAPAGRRRSPRCTSRAAVPAVPWWRGTGGRRRGSYRCIARFEEGTRPCPATVVTACPPRAPAIYRAGATGPRG